VTDRRSSRTRITTSKFEIELLTTPDSANVRSLYDRLFDAYGPQHWWPGDSPYEVIVGAILTQNTNWTNVEKALAALRAADVWSFEAIRVTERSALATLIRPSGYFNQKARKLHEFASLISDDFRGQLDDLLDLPMAELRTTLLGIWGIGDETADDIVLYAAKKPSFVIDTYTRRIVDRLGWRADGDEYRDYQSLFADRLPHDAPLFNEFHALLDEHAATVCRPTPKCDGCCLKDICVTGKTFEPT
jgi:endonuclease III related protein